MIYATTPKASIAALTLGDFEKIKKDPTAGDFLLAVKLQNEDLDALFSKRKKR